ncbi:MAG: gluconokinase [Cyclobacteriaceae bacterium]|nr:gluconokinase [Cyclobacteriaceae bacterium]
MTYIIGIDIGTGSTKAVALNSGGDVLHSTQVSYPTLNPEPDYSEQAPEIIWQAFVKCISRMVDFLNDKPAGIVLSTAMHSVIPVDAKGNPLMNMIIWADNRSASIAKRIKESSSGEMIYTQTGMPIHAMTPLCKILWIKENMPDLFIQVHKYISIKEYIWYKLFHVYEVDYSIASATGLFELEKLRWNANSLDLCGIQLQQLSQPVPVDHVRKKIDPTLADSLKLTVQTPIFIGSSDGCMANIGSFAIDNGIAALTIGTSGAIRIGSKKPTFNFKAMTFTYCLFDNLFISGGPINNGGIALKWFAESFLKIKLDSPEAYEVLLGGIEKTNPGADGLIFLPYLLGERAPIWDSHSSAVFFGLKNFHTQAHLTRAVVEGISMALFSISKAMEKTGLTISKIHVSGGFVHSKSWLQILADIFNKEISLIHQEDASAIGAAYLGLKSLGIITTFSQLKPTLQTSFEPNTESHKIYQKLFPIYERLYEKLKDEMLLLQDVRK